MEHNLLFSLDLVGTFVFAISGILIASKNNFDWFGALIIGFVTALGGGTLRDILMGSLPVGWIQNPQYLYLIITATIFTIIFKSTLRKLPKTLLIFDTIGIATFTVLGVQKSLQLDLDPIIAVSMGVSSAVFGGVLRDVLVREVPLIFREELYATPCILGACLYLILVSFTESLTASLITVAFIILFRILALHKHWTLPKL